MKKKNPIHLQIFALITISQIIIAGMSFFLPVVNLWIDQMSVGELIVGFISLETTIIAGGIAWAQYKESDVRRSFEERFVRVMSNVAYGRWLNVHEFYSLFLAELENCHHRVNIATLRPTPPSEISNKRIRKYYEESIAVIKKRRNEPIHYRRIIRFTNANWEWIQTLYKEMEHVSNFSLAVLVEDKSERRNPLALSVQTVDGERVYLVAIKERGGYDPERDLLISSPEICKGFDAYYDRLWESSILLIEEGRTIQQNFDRLKKMIS